MTASTVEGTPLRHNETDWAAKDVSVCLSVKAVHQLPLTQTCLSVCTAPLSGLLSVLLLAWDETTSPFMLFVDTTDFIANISV